ncbi:vacuolar protein sorting-associated protein 37A-like [Acropora palmata]|uniref:vacuolar protein sorting-associated protein 37A-like n=1 Tax=Acropora palmata TaxID=6131 RepID=UPI003D9FE695
MSWLFGSSKTSKSQLPPTTALQQQRMKQVDSLRSFHNINEVQRDVEYRVTISLGNSTIFLNITLPPQFPNERPVVKVAPQLLHPWVNDQMMVVGCSAINNFYMHSNLGRAVMDIINEFKDHPPQFIGSQTSQTPFTTSPSSFQPLSSYSFAGYQPRFPPPSSAPPIPPSLSSLNSPLSQYAPPSVSSPVTAMSHSPANAQITQTTPSRPPPIPPRPSAKAPSSFAELDSFSLEELKDLNDKPEVMEVFLANLESVKKFDVDKEKVMLKNEELARFNLSLQSKLETSKDELLKMCERLSDLKQTFVKSSQKQQELTEVLSMASIRTQMEIAANEAEEQSEAIADEFLAKQMPLEEFIQKFLEKRKLCHSRRAKEDKLRHLHTRY